MNDSYLPLKLFQLITFQNKENNELEYLGAIIYGNTTEVDEITGKFQLWKQG